MKVDLHSTQIDKQVILPTQQKLQAGSSRNELAFGQGRDTTSSGLQNRNSHAKQASEHCQPDGTNIHQYVCLSDIALHSL
jgi:hypothetical protein